MSRILLHPQNEFILCSGFRVRLGGAIRGQHDSGKGCQRIGVSIDDHQGPWGNQWEHGWAIEFGIDTRHDTIVESTNKLRAKCCVIRAGGFFYRRLDCPDPRLPLIVLESPAEALDRK